jgi:hypothetical protein
MVSAVLLKIWHCVVGPYALPFCRSKVRSCRSSSGSSSLGRLPKSAAEFKNWNDEKGRHHFLLVIVCVHCVNWPRTVEVPSKLEFLIGLPCGLVQQWQDAARD